MDHSREQCTNSTEFHTPALVAPLSRSGHLARRGEGEDALGTAGKDAGATLRNQLENLRSHRWHVTGGSDSGHGVPPILMF